MLLLHVLLVLNFEIDFDIGHYGNFTLALVPLNVQQGTYLHKNRYTQWKNSRLLKFGR